MIQPETFVDRRGADDQRGRPRVRKPELHEDAAQDRDGRDRHGHREEQLEAEQRHGLGQPRVKPRRREIAHHERNRDAEQADPNDGPAVASQVPVELELEPDLKHQEDQADLSESREDRAGRGMEEPVHEFREDRPQQARPEEQARKDLAGYVGLGQPPNDPGHDARRDEDRDELVQEPKRDLLGAGADGRLLTAGRDTGVRDDERRGAERGQDEQPEHRG